jgi:hypothetical protein
LEACQLVGEALGGGQVFMAHEGLDGAEAAWAEFRKHEIEAQLALGATDRIEVRNGQPDSMAGPVAPVTIKVSLFSRRGKHESVLEVSPEDLETLASTHGAVQLAFW